MTWKSKAILGQRPFLGMTIFYSGMAVSLTCQSCALACHQRLILPLYLDAQINTAKYLSFCDIMSAFRDYAWPSKQRTGQPSELHIYIQFNSIRLLY